jgi:hypothetical protein
MLNSLAAVTKLLVNSSALSGKQQQQQQQQQQQDAINTRIGSVTGRTAEGSAAWPMGLATTIESSIAATTAQPGRGGVESAAVGGGVAAMRSGGISSGAAAVAAADARWAEQEHALLLMRSILQVC